MENLSPGWDLSPVRGAEISARTLWQLLTKMKFRLHVQKFQLGLNFSPDWSFQPGLHHPGWDFQPGQTGWKFAFNRNEISARAEFGKILRPRCERGSGKNSNHALCGVIHDVSKERREGKYIKVQENNGTIRFRWDIDDNIENLIRCLANNKSQMDHQNIDFNGDKVK